MFKYHIGVKYCFVFVLNIAVHLSVTSQDAIEVYQKTVNSTVTIETDKGSGSGFIVSNNIIATNYHVIEGASTISCYLNNSDSSYEIDGYLAADKNVDLILLSAKGINRSPIKLSNDVVTPGQKIYVLGSPKGLPATISDGIVSGLRDIDGQKLIQITAPISPGSSGGPVMNSEGELIGVSVGQFIDGQNLNFAIPKTNLELLINFKKSYPIPISSLYSSTKKSDEHEKNYYGKDRYYDIGIFKRGDPDLSLDFFANIGEESIFHFTYNLQSKSYISQTIYMEDYRLVDLESGEIYYMIDTDLPKKNNPRVIYKGTKTRFTVTFERLPSNVKRFSLMEGECSEASFCFLGVNLDDYYNIREFDQDIYRNTNSEGTITFYQNQKRIGNIDIYIEGYFVGTLSQYFLNSSYVGNSAQSDPSIPFQIDPLFYVAANGFFSVVGFIQI